MTGSDVALVLTATGGLCATMVGGVLAIIREVRAGRHETREVAAVVNGRHTEALAYNEQLIRRMTAAGVAVPRDPSLIPPVSHRGADNPH